MTFIAGTGTRQIQLLPATEKAKVLDLIINQLDLLDEGLGLRAHTVISGMAEGFDSALAAAAIKHGNPLWCFIPNRGYGNYYWAQHSKTGHNRMAQFNAILDKAEHVEYTSEVLGTSGLYYQGVHMNFHRNQHMVDKADILFAWAENEQEADGGTRDCIKRWMIKRENSGALYYPIVYLKSLI